MTRLRLAVARWLLRGTGWGLEECSGDGYIWCVIDEIGCRVMDPEEWWPWRERFVGWWHAEGRKQWLGPHRAFGAHLHQWMLARAEATARTRTAPPAAYQPSTVCDLSGPAPRKE